MYTIKLILKTILYRPLFNALIFLVWLVPGHNVAWAIIILTIAIRLLLLPSSIKATYQQKRMRELQPEIQKIQEKYKGDREKLSQATMAFYRENNIHPLGSCLPLLIQLPILIVLYYVFINGLGTQRFDLLYSFTPHPELIKTVFLGIDLAKPDRYILPVIAGILQFVQGRQMMPKVDSKKGEELQTMVSKQMLYITPILTIIIAGRFPAALPLYWIITSLFSVVQQWWVLKDKSQIKIQKSKNNVTTIDKKEDKTVKGGVELTVRTKKSKEKNENK